MQQRFIDLMPITVGTQHRLQVLHFGHPQARPRAVLQAALHADELPGMLVLHHLRKLLLDAEAQGRMIGSICVLPYANPLGLAQQGLGHPVGRFALADGSNFNRGFPWLGDAAIAACPAAADDVRRAVRQAMHDALASQRPRTAVEHLKHTLLQLAIDADIVLDLHCDGEALMHLYTLASQADTGLQLGRLLGARALLVADDSGDTPFDEACSRPWLALQQAHPQHDIPLACFAATVELRGQADVDQALAAADARALFDFLVLQRVIAGECPTLPPARCAATALAASEPIDAPHGGLIAFHRGCGDQIEANDVIAELIDPADGAVTPIRATAPGLLYARINTRLAVPGKRIAKVAGTTLHRTGTLLSP